jgi:hypothetical protein
LRDLCGKDRYIDLLVEKVAFDEDGLGLFCALGRERPKLFKAAFDLTDFAWRQFKLLGIALNALLTRAFKNLK